MQGTDFLPPPDVVDEIRAAVLAHEEKRRAAFAGIRWRVPVFIGMALALEAVLVFLLAGVLFSRLDIFAPVVIGIFVVGLLAAGFAWYLAKRPGIRLQQGLREQLMPLIFGYVEGLTYRNAQRPASLARLPKSAAGDWTKETVDDVLAGTLNGLAFELYEVELERNLAGNVSTTFNGVILAFRTLSPFPGTLVAAHKPTGVSRFFRDIFGRSALQEVRAGVSAIDEHYECRSDNRAAAQPLIAGRLATALRWVDETWADDAVRVALAGDDGFLMLPTKRKNYFELPDIAVPLDYERHVEPMITEFALFLTLGSLVREATRTD